MDKNKKGVEKSKKRDKNSTNIGSKGTIKGKGIKDKENKNPDKKRDKLSILDRIFKRKPKENIKNSEKTKKQTKRTSTKSEQNLNPVVKDANRKIFGSLGKKSKKQEENLQRQRDLHSVDSETRREIIEDQEGRIPLVFEEETELRDRKPIGSFIRRENKRKTTTYTSEKQRELARKYQEKRFEIIRQENDDYRPLHELNIWNKLRTAKRYRDEKSGKIAERESAKQRKINEQKIKIESKIKREITEITDNIVNGDMEEASLEITIDPEHVDCLERVLMGDYFAMFRVEQREPNPNLKVFNIYPPISLVFKRNLKRSEI